MATTVSNDPQTSANPPVAPASDAQSGGLARWRFTALLALSAIAVVAFGVFFAFRGLTQTDSGPQLTHTVARGELIVKIAETGDIESASNKEIKCLVAGGSTILSIVKDGEVVGKDDVLVKLDSSTIEEEISQQKINYEKARAAHIQAESDAAVAELAVTEYMEGTFRAELQLAQSNVAIAEENLRTAENRLNYTQRMFSKGYVSVIERDGQVFAVEHANLELELKRTEEDVLRRFTKAKTLQELRSALKAAQAQMASEAAAFELEATRLERLERQRENCVILAPQDGMVIYPEVYRWSQEPEVKEGAQVREQQTLIQLPDLTQMQVKVQIHESNVELIEQGMVADITIQDQQLKGEVISISNRAEQSGWWSGSAKEFATIVRIDGHEGLKPGMSADVSIHVAKYTDVLTVPVAAVLEQHERFYCWIRSGQDVEIRPIVVGPSNEQFIVVKTGLAEGDAVVLNPAAFLEDAQLRALEPPIVAAEEADSMTDRGSAEEAVVE